MILSQVVILHIIYFYYSVDCGNVGYLETAVGVVQSVKTIGNKISENSAAAASKLDMLMPPIEFSEAIVGIADVTSAPPNLMLADKEHNDHTPHWWHSYDALLVALGMAVLLIVIFFVTHYIWRRHIERRALEWEAENERIFSSAPYYIDQSHILVY